MSLGPCQKCGKNEIYFIMGLKEHPDFPGVWVDKVALCEICFDRSEYKNILAGEPSRDIEK